MKLIHKNLNNRLEMSKKNPLFYRKRNDDGEYKENETSRWKKVWNNIFKKIKRGGRKKV